MGLNRTVPARDAGYQNVQYLYRAFTYLDDGKTIDVGTLPTGALILKSLSGVHVEVAFNGGSTNTLDVGPSNDSGTNLWATILALGTIGFIPLDEAVSNIVASGQNYVQAKVVSTATPSAGKGHIVIAFINPAN